MIPPARQKGTKNYTVDFYRDMAKILAQVSNSTRLQPVGISNQLSID